MSAMSNYLEGKFIDHLLRTDTFAKPAGIYVALYTTLETDAAGGVEVSGGNYSRVAVTQLDANWNAPTGGDGLTDNVSDITFPTPSATWGLIVGFAVWDASSAGNMLLHGALTVSKQVNGSDPAPKFTAGDLDFTFA